MPRSDIPEHGSRPRYERLRCRCDACRAGNAARKRRVGAKARQARYARGEAPKPLGRRQQHHDDAVAVEHLQRCWRDSGLSSVEAAARCGWMRTKRRTGRAPQYAGDASRFMRVIGLRWHKSGKGQGHTTRKYVDYELAVHVVRALGGDPVDYGV